MSSKASSKVAPGSKLYPTDPIAATAGAVTSWFSLAHSSSVITGSGYSSIHDILNPSSPIAQSTDALRPPNARSANGLPIITNVAGQADLALIAARANTTTWGFWGWFRQATNADSPLTFRPPLTSANRHLLFFRVSGTGLRFQAYANATDTRIMDVNGLTAGAWQFITLEYNGNRSGDARAIFSVNGVVPTLSYGTGSGVAEMPATLVSVTGSGSIFALGSAGPFFVGSWGTNFGFFGAAMASATEGLLTQQARLALMNYQRPI